MLLNARIKLFVILAALFITSLIVGDIIGVKLVEVHLGSIVAVMSVGMLPFPVTFLLTDLLNEFYGKKAARFVTFTGFFMAVFCFVVIALSVGLPWAPLTQAAEYSGTVEKSFDNVFSGSQRILVASMVAYLSAQLIDISVFNFLKQRTHNRMLWLRATGSTVVSQLMDTVVVQVVAWTGVLPADVIIRIILTSYLVKLLVAVGLTPLIYAGHALLQERLGIHPVVLDEHGEPLPDGAAVAAAVR